MFLERAERLIERHVRIKVVGKVQLDLIDPEALEACVELALDPLRREPAVGAGIHRVERLRRQRRSHPTGSHPHPDRPLAAAAAVRVGGVEVRQAELPCSIHQLECLLLGQALTEELGRRTDSSEVAATKRDAGQHEIRVLEAATLDLECGPHRLGSASDVLTSNI